MPEPEAPPTGTGARPWLVLALMALPLLALSIDVNGAGTILPDISRDLGVSSASVAWVMSASSLAFAAALVPLGKVTDWMGRRRLLLIGVGGFGASSALCAAAPDLALIIVGRVGQGISGALCFTTSLAVVDAVFDDRRRAAAIGVWGVVNGVGATVGPLFGGLMVAVWSWRGFFLVNVPLCLVALPLLAWSVPGDRRRQPPPQAPWARLASLSAGLVLTIVAVQTAGSAGWRAPAVVVCGVLGIALLLLLVRARREGASPLLSPAVSRSPLFPAAAAVAFCSTWGFGVAIVYMAVFLQTVQGRPALDAGFAFCAFSAAFSVAGLANGPMAGRLGLRTSLLVAMVVATVGMAWLGLLRPGTGLVVVVLALAVAGAGQGLAFNLSTSASLYLVPVAAAGEASGAVQTFRLVGFSLGVAASTTIVAAVGTEGGGLTADDVRAVLLAAALVSVVGMIGSRLPSLGGRPGVRAAGS